MRTRVSGEKVRWEGGEVRDRRKVTYYILHITHDPERYGFSVWGRCIAVSQTSDVMNTRNLSII